MRDGLPYPYTEKDAKDYINAMLARDKNQVFAFAICIDDRTVGSIGAFRQNNINYRTAELGYYLAEEYWGKGIMIDVVRQLCDMLFAKQIFSEYMPNLLLITKVQDAFSKRQAFHLKA